MRSWLKRANSVYSQAGGIGRQHRHDASRLFDRDGLVRFTPFTFLKPTPPMRAESPAAADTQSA